MAWVALAVLGSAAAVSLALSPAVADPWAMWLLITLPYVSMAGLASWRLARAGQLRARLTPRFGDASTGAIVALLLLLAFWLMKSWAFAPGSAEHAWLARVFWQLGAPAQVRGSYLLTTMVLVVAAAEEVIWRGWVLYELAERFGRRVALPLSSVLYAVTVAPTLVLLAVPGVGFNPLPLLAALGGGLVWGFFAGLSGRVPAMALSHAAVTYFFVTSGYLRAL